MLISSALISRQHSIIIPTYVTDFKKFNILRETISSLINTIDTKYLNLIIVDDCSPYKYDISDIVESKIKTYIINNDKNLGFAKTVNKGIEFVECTLSQYGTICVANDDLIFSKNWLQYLICHLTEETIFVSPRIHNAVTKVYDGAEKIHPNGCCIVGETQTWLKYNGYSTDYGRGYFEDTDLLTRVINDGHKWVNVNCVTITHLFGSTFRALKDNSEIFVNARKVFKEKWGFDAIERYYPHLTNEHVYK